MRNCWKLLLPLAFLTGCQGEEMPEQDGRRVDFAALSHGMIELGEKLDDPYTVANMQEAVARLYPTKAGAITIRATDLYPLPAQGRGGVRPPAVERTPADGPSRRLPYRQGGGLLSRSQPVGECHHVAVCRGGEGF